jgi:hypothetical protein
MTPTTVFPPASTETDKSPALAPRSPPAASTTAPTLPFESGYPPGLNSYITREE